METDATSMKLINNIVVILMGMDFQQEQCVVHVVEVEEVMIDKSCHICKLNIIVWYIYIYISVECEDISPNCDVNANENNCRTNDFIRERCQKSCGICGIFNKTINILDYSKM